MRPHLTRAWFLGAGGAVLVAGCGHAHHGGALPPGSSAQSAARDVSTAVAPVSDAILREPILAETFRFEGAVVPPQWMRAEGQTLSRADYPQLAAILSARRQSATFTLPKAYAPTIIAVAGTVPANPRQLAKLRPMSGARLGVSVAGIEVRAAPPAWVPMDVPEAHPTWYPGTMATPALLEEQRRATAIFPERTLQ